MSLTREQILKASDIAIEKVSVPEWGGDVYVKGMTAKERDSFESSIIIKAGKHQRVNMNNIRAKLVARSICDKDGELMFTEKDVSVLADKSASAMQKVFAVAQRLSGITEEDTEDLLKN